MHSVIPWSARARRKAADPWALSGEQHAGGWQVIDDRRGGLVIVGLPLAQMQQQQAAFVVADHPQLAGQPPWCIRYIGAEPLFEQAGRHAMRLEVGGIDHQPVGTTALGGRLGKDAVT